MTKLEAEWIKTKMGIVEHCVKDNARMWAVPNKAIVGILEHCKIVRDYCQETQDRRNLPANTTKNSKRNECERLKK
jgi:hypothetical protein